MNPCNCGFSGDAARQCSCTPPMVDRYRSRLSGPLLDRIDLHIPVPAVKYRDLVGEESCDDSAAIRARILAARDTQRQRLGSFGVACNAHMAGRAMRRFCKLDEE